MFGELPEPDMNRVPDNIFSVMEHLYVNRAILGDVLLAGGAPRDLMFGADISDWDFFVPSSGPRQTVVKMGHVHDVMSTLGWEAHDLVKINEDYSDDWVVRDYHKDLIKVQMIFSEQRLQDFDISTCQIGIDMTGEWHMSPHFISTLRHRYHTVFMKNYKTRYQLGIGLGRHLPRLLEKYPWNVFLDYEGVNIGQCHNWMTGNSGVPF